MTKPYSVAFKQKMVQRLIGKDSISATELSRETGVRQQNLSRWLVEARSLSKVVRDQKKPRWTVEEKARLVAATANLTGEELKPFLEREGVRLSEVEGWRLALDDRETASMSMTRRIRNLERELARKEKALAEAAALLILKKSGCAVSGRRGRRFGQRERELILAAVSEAQASGARLTVACQVAGISARTAERWRARPGGEARLAEILWAGESCDEC